jgi:uncharacterized paraquat-inducible protein A
MRHAQRRAHLHRCGAAIHRRKSNAISRGWAFLLAALIFYIPANLLPVMHRNARQWQKAPLAVACWSSGKPGPGTLR